MIDTKVISGALSCSLFLLAGCLHNQVDIDSGPVLMSSMQTEAVTCEDDPLDFYNAMPVSDENEVDTTAPNSLQSDDCKKLRKAIRLSMPGSKNQNDEKALNILNELAQSSTLTGRDIKFSLLLLQHVSLRQQLRKRIETQEKRLMNSEQKNSALKSQLEILQSQLDQLKKLEIEIDKKERSVISPIGE